MDESSDRGDSASPLRWIPRQKDGESLYLHFTGGIRAGRIQGDQWALEPVLVSGRPASNGFFSRADLARMERSLGLTAIAFQHAGWDKGSYYSNWVPIIPGQTNHMLGAADLWRNITSQIGRQRRGHLLRELVDPSRDDVASIFDDQEPDERLAAFVALSLRGLDISVEEISGFYHEQLVDLMADGKLNGERVSGTLDHLLYAHVHSFFLHAGAARDYLASLIAFRLGEDPNVDSLALLCKKLRSRHVGTDSLLNVLVDRGLIAESKQKGMWVSAGWIKNLSDLRNLFTHRRPYGSRSCEHWGSAVPLSDKGQLYRYRRPFQTDNGEDIFDLIVRQYRHIIGLFHLLANASGLNTDIQVFTDDDIIELRTD
ncbi:MULTISPECIES: hypothetical protein [Rhizobium]|uniref:Uncharacterized protein n=1 Tax=Rhizobium laguerreae TaxID=1076926 RepID=A0A7Y2W538_9HYPH|nr:MULTISPECIES: hypothetical protein [Rhizobium]MBY5441941.1 hypothetical protein [Rhizobium leguminosarum]NNH63738.1 hypothetical protein [Rhizobium laguerreae]